MEVTGLHGGVVVGVDGSEPSRAALAWAVRHAATGGHRLVVVHACGVAGAMEDFEDVSTSERALVSVGRAVVREALAEARRIDPGVPVDPMVTMGSAAAVLLEASEAAGMVVLGARGLGSVASALLGSVSAVVTRQAHCPVVVVRGYADEERRPVVVGVDGTPASAAAVEFAFRRASTENVPLTILHATWDLRTRAATVLDTQSYAERIDLDEREERLVSETIAGMCEAYPDVVVTELYRRGEPVRQLVEASRGASLVVVGSRGRGLVSSALLGSVSRGVVEHAASPVAVVRP